MAEKNRENDLASTVVEAEKSPKISVIVPVYKVEKYLPECIESVLAQTFTDFELILVDDGSPDNSGKICDDYAKKDSRIRVFHKENGGVSSARNLGLDNARGEWIAFVDPDDWIDKDTYKELYDVVVSSNADWSFCDFVLENQLRSSLCSQVLPKKSAEDVVGAFILGDLHGAVWNKLIRASIFRGKKGVRFPVDIAFCEDLFVSVQLPMAGLVGCHVPKAFYHYRIREGAASFGRGSRERLLDSVEVLRRIAKLREREESLFHEALNDAFCRRKMWMLLSGLFQYDEIMSIEGNPLYASRLSWYDRGILRALQKKRYFQVQMGVFLRVKVRSIYFLCINFFR